MYCIRVRGTPYVSPFYVCQQVDCLSCTQSLVCVLIFCSTGSFLTHCFRLVRSGYVCNVSVFVFYASKWTVLYITLCVFRSRKMALLCTALKWYAVGTCVVSMCQKLDSLYITLVCFDTKGSFFMYMVHSISSCTP